MFGLPSAFAQQLVNEDFETWIDNTAFEDPEGWVTLNDLSPEYGIPFTVLKSTDAKEGKYAAHLQTYTFLDGNNNTDTLPSVLVYGTSVNSGVSYTWPKRLKSISFTYKYLPNGVDTGIMFVAVGYRNRPTNRYVNQGGASYMFTKKETTYTKVNLPLYYNSGHKCDTFVLAFVNSLERPGGNRSKPGTVLIIDDIDTDWEPFPVMAKIDEPEQRGFVYPNPATESIHINGLPEGRYRAELTDAFGRKTGDLQFEGDTLQVGHLPVGLYYLTLTGSDNRRIMSTQFYKK